MEVSIEEQVLEAQAFGYAVCSVQSNALAIDDSLYGECGCEHDCRAMFYQWGVEIMNTTKAVDCDCNDKCVTAEFACEVMRLINPGCIVCGCGNPDDVPFDCSITQDITVYQALDADQETVIPNVAGRITLIISNTTPVTNSWSAHLGDTATDDGTGVFTYATPQANTVIFASSENAYYVAYPGGAGPYFPSIDGNQVGTTLTLVSRTPYVTLLYGRDVVVEISDDGITWLPVYSGPEAPLAYGVPVTLAGGFSPDRSRTTYYYGEENECQRGTFPGTIPPYVPPPCGILGYSVTPNSVCATDNWNIAVNFTQIDGWGLGTITPTVNGVAGTPVGITLGTTTFGPYIMGDLVTFTIVNNLNGACDITTPTYFDPRFTAQQNFTVAMAVDANQFSALSGNGNNYYIVSNVDSLASNWGLHVGEIWNGGSSTYTNPANLNIIYASNPGGAQGFWQDDGGTPRRIFPQPTYTLNTVTLVPVATLPTLPPFTLAWSTLFMQASCPSSSVTAYSGTPSAFSTSPFPLPPCSWSTVTGFAAYSNGCAVRVPAITATYTPPGEPDPDFFTGGVNDVVYALAPQANGAFLAGGAFTRYDHLGTNIVANRIARFNADGTLDTAFNDIVNDASLPEADRGFNANVLNVHVDTVGRIIVSGTFTTFNGQPASHLCRLNADGTLDTAFMAQGGNMFNAGVGLPVYTSLQPNNSILCSGFFTSYNGSAANVANRMCRITTAGALDTTYNTGLLAPGAPAGQRGLDVGAGYNSISPDGTCLITGSSPGSSFTRCNGYPVRPGGSDRTIIRVGTDGSLTAMVAQGTQFTQPVPATRNYQISQPDGKIICIGSFTNYNGTAVGRLIRLDSVGNVDLAFTTNNGTGFDNQTMGVDLFPSGYIMVGGMPGNFNGVAHGGLVRLLADGTRDPLFDLGGVGFDSAVYTVMVDSFGDVVVGGAFSTLNGSPMRRLTKLT